MVFNDRIKNAERLQLVIDWSFTIPTKNTAEYNNSCQFTPLRVCTRAYMNYFQIEFLFFFFFQDIAIAKLYLVETKR